MNQQDSFDANDNAHSRAHASQDVPAQDAKDFGKKKKEKKQAPWYVEIPVAVLVTLIVVGLLQAFVGRIYMIPSQSMEPTLHGCSGCIGDRILVEKITYRFSDPKPGDVIVFEGTESWNRGVVSQRSANPLLRGVQNIGSFVGVVAPDENNLVKRIVATGGQTVQCLPGDEGIMVDGSKVDDSFTLSPFQYPINEATGSQACGGDYFGPITVPDKHLFMMGDNRTNSSDSRYHLGDDTQGTIPLENVRGKVSAIVFPFNRMGLVDDPEIQH
ncbi:signal peptidase I [Corynebacterium felinum]|uniref:Signal peptidase I n=1 Tax=Corynebacterium felinum TaxID=131318 RepID=A0ABU2BBP4_9CORY|nr:signal peptidase I [Corynebacterium felinum]